MTHKNIYKVRYHKKFTYIFMPQHENDKFLIDLKDRNFLSPDILFCVDE